jgi:hypothetical protein
MLATISAAALGWALSASPSSHDFVAASTADGTRLVLRPTGRGAAEGSIVFEGYAYPISVRIRPSSDGFVAEGTLLDEGEPIPFVARRRGEWVSAEAAGEQVRLRVVQEGTLMGRSVPGRPSSAGRVEPPATAKPPRPATPDRKPDQAPAKVRLRTVTYDDVNMNGMAAYTQLVPRGWKAEGRIQWAPASRPFPQRSIHIEAPSGIAIDYLPAMVFEYLEVDPQVAAFSARNGTPIRMPEPNLPPPENIGAWLARRIEQADPEVRAAHVRSSVRDRERERWALQMAGQDTRTTHHRISIGFEKGGRSYRSEVLLGYQVLPLDGFQAGRSVKWVVYIDHIATFPNEQYDAYAPVVYAVVGSLRPTPRWFAAKTRTLNMLAQQRHRNAMALIRQSGQRQSDANDAQMASWRRQQAMQDRGHKMLVNSIGEVEDYAVPGGGTVNLPSFYDHVYQTKQGDYLLSEQPIEDVDLTKLRPARP